MNGQVLRIMHYKKTPTTTKNMNMVSSRRARVHFIMHLCYNILCRYSSLTSSPMTLSTVHPWGDRLCVGCLEPVWLPATGEPEDHPRNQVVWRPLLACDLSQLQTWWKLRPAPARAEESNRSVTEILQCWSHLSVVHLCLVFATPSFEAP